jgi:O-antigen/teichoic acid export membrane protein
MGEWIPSAGLEPGIGRVVRATEQVDANGQPPTAAGSRDILATAKGGGFLAAGTIFEFATRFVIALMLARGLGANDYGLYVLAISAASLFAGISLLGTDDAMVRYVAILSGRRDEDGVSGTMQIGFGMALLGGLVMGGVLFVCAGPIAVGLFHAPELVRVFRLFAMVVPFLTVSNTLLGMARGFRRMDYAALSQNVIQSMVRIVLVALLALGGWLHLYAAAVAFGLSDVAASVALIALLNRVFPLKRSLDLRARRDLRAIFGFALPLWLAGLLRQFRRNIQNLMLGVMSSVANVGIFAIANRVNLVAGVSSQSIYIASRPLMAQLHDRRDHEALGSLYTATTRWTFGLNIPFFLVMVLYPGPLLLAFGKPFAAGATALVILACGQMVDAGTGTCQGMIDMTGHTRVKLANAIALTALLVGGGALFIPRWGVLGAAVASLVAVSSVNVASIVEVWIFEKLLPFDRSFWKPAAAGLGAFIAGLLLRARMPVGTAPAAVPQAAIVSTVYVGLILALGLEPQDRLVIDRVLGKAKRLIHRPLRIARIPGREVGVSEVRLPGGTDPASPPEGDDRRTLGAEAAGVRLGPVFIGGLDRSGKTTMRAFLASHPNIAIPAVGSNMETYFYGRFGDLGRPENLERCLRAMLRYKHVRFLAPDAEWIRREYRRGAPTYGRLFSLFLIRYAEREGKPRWGAQTGLIERYADHLFAAYPGVKVIHMVRDPRDRYEASLAAWPDGNGRAGGATARWRYSVGLAERNLRRYPADYKVVRFEDMVLRTEETVRDVCGFIGEAFLPEMLSMPGAPKHRDRLLDGDRISSADAPLSARFVGRYRGAVPPRELAFMQLHAARLMRAYGYPPERLDLSWRDRILFSTYEWPRQAARMVAWRGFEALQQRFPARVPRTPGPRMIIADPPEGSA